MFNQPQKTVLITGAATGIGKLTTSMLLAKGQTVIAAVRGGQERLEQAFSAEELQSGRLHGVDISMERPETFAHAKEIIDQRFGGKLDVLINNAGYGALGPVETQTEEQIRHQMDVNFTGPVLLTNLLLPALRAARGRILNLSGVVGYISFPFYAAYSASKHAIEGYSEGLAGDLRPFGVQVGIVQPGGFRTNFASTASKSTALVPGDSPYSAPAQAMTRFLSEQSASLGGDPRAVAKTLVKLTFRRRVPIRTRVGADAWMLALMRWLLPDGLRMTLVNGAMARVLFRPQ